VGNYVPISPGALPRFLECFTQVYGNLGKTESIISTASLPSPGSAGIYGRWGHAPLPFPNPLASVELTRVVERGIEPRPAEGYAL
jgi:hypothetical protein